ncbi:TRAP transporter small permease [Hahella aquimaris]|uniref:TRAP transporter small permease n=1 Tax=Hahella sp. HNIBRBA332 TaxID=3015983 RepID=UPI00273CA8E1|nr:TRAP transporter small permease [Hahella sp. HNIBRBA332]WLQ14202.1 TRAP transporter small permease [Hahella sp. HNIBRBA332]
MIALSTYPTLRQSVRTADAWLAIAAQCSAYLSGAALVAIVMMVTLSVFGRWLFGTAVTGDFEIVEIGVATAIFYTFPACQYGYKHLAVDLLVKRLPLGLEKAACMIAECALCAIFAFIGWRLVHGAEEFFSYDEQTMILAIPLGWVLLACAPPCFLSALIAVSNLLQKLVTDK